MKIRVDIDPEKILAVRGLGADTKVRKFMASEVKRMCDPYVPMRAGASVHMKNSAQVAADGSTVVYPGPYAHYQYVGEIMGPNIPITKGGHVVGYYSKGPKHYTGRPLDYHGGPMRGKEWDKRMLADRGDELVKAVAKYVGGKPK